MHRAFIRADGSHDASPSGRGRGSAAGPDIASLRAPIGQRRLRPCRTEARSRAFAGRTCAPAPATRLLVAPGFAVEPGVRTWEDAATSLAGRVCWLDRAEAERSARFVQLIPCAAVRGGGRWLLLRRAPGPSASLSVRLSLVAGGHADGEGHGGGALALLRAALERELDEELGLGAREAPLNREPFAVLRDGASGPAARHAAIVWIADAARGAVEVAPGDEYDPDGTRWASIAEVRAVRSALDPWSDLLLDALPPP